MKKGDEFIVNIERFSNLGTGIAKIDGQIVFVENACPEDKVKIRISSVTKNYANASVTEIIEPSRYRTNPICPLQRICGSCQLGFIDYDYQLKLKHNIVEDSILKIGNIDTKVQDTIPSPKIKN